VLYVGKGIVGPHIIRRDDSGNINRHTAVSLKQCVYRLETISFLAIVIKAESRRRAKCCVCLTDKDRTNAVNSVGFQNVCARTALTDISSNKQEFEGTIIILRDYIHI
jgi:hypothetical protein